MIHLSCFYSSLFHAFFLCLPLSLWGQYSVVGTVQDDLTHDPLPGATIQIGDTGKGGITDENGYFRITDIQEKKITIKVSFIGYDTWALDHEFSGKKVVELDIRLKSGAEQLIQVEVEGQAEGQVRAMIQQKRAENIMNVLSAEQIAAFPDVNAAEAMQRLPGISLQRDQGEGRYVQLRGTPPELTNFNINGEQVPSPEGNVRYVGMDVIAADQIETIEVIKVLTPDMDADGIGGTVNIVTKNARSESPEIKAVIAGGYNNLRTTDNYQLQFSYGQRSGRFGFQLNSSYYLNNLGSDNMEFEYAKGPFFGSQNSGNDNYFVQYREFQLRHYTIRRSRIGISPSLDYQIGKNSYIYLRGIYNRFTDEETRRRVIYDLDDALSATYYLYGGIQHDLRDRVKQQDLSSLNLGGKHAFRGFTIDYQLAVAYAAERRPEQLEVVFDNPGQAIAMEFDLTESNWPRVNFPIPGGATNAFDYGNYEMDALQFEESRVTDLNITPRLNLEIPLSMLNGSKGYVKFGGKIRMKEKERDIKAQAFGAYFPQSTVYPGVGPALSLVTVDNGFRTTDLLNHGYVLESIPDPEKVQAFYEFYPQHFIFDRTATKVQSYGEDYHAEEKIYAGYGMIRQDWNKLMVLAGLRYEKTNIDYQGIRIITNKGNYQGMDTLQDTRNHTFFLPQVQLKYAISNNFNLRAALTYTYSRPNFEDVLPYREEDRDEVKYGNPDLAYPRSTNIDLLAEKYLKRGGILSAGLFYKQIDDFVFYYKRFAHEGDPKDYGLVEITKAINGIQASVYGAEIQSQFKFDFLRGFFKDAGLFINYTYTHSEAAINKRFPANYSNAVVIFGEDDLDLFTSSTEREKIVLPGQAKHTANFALFYESKKFYARLSANYHDAFLYRLGADKDLDEYYDAAWRLDFTANASVSKNAKIFVDLINLTNAPLKFYLGTPERIKTQEFYAWWGRIGVKLSF